MTVGGFAHLFRVGEAVSDASLRLVYLDHVVIERAGRLETLTLQLREALGATSARVLPQSVSNKPGLHDQRTLADVMRAEPAAASGGRGGVQGVRIYAGRNRQAFASAGLKAGDLVTAIDGVSIVGQDAAKVQLSFDEIRSSGSATLRVLRLGGHIADINVVYP